MKNLSEENLFLLKVTGASLPGILSLSAGSEALLFAPLLFLFLGVFHLAAWISARFFKKVPEGLGIVSAVLLIAAVEAAASFWRAPAIPFLSAVLVNAFFICSGGGWAKSFRVFIWSTAIFLGFKTVQFFYPIPPAGAVMLAIAAILVFLRTMIGRKWILI